MFWKIFIVALIKIIKLYHVWSLRKFVEKNINLQSFEDLHSYIWLFMTIFQKYLFFVAILQLSYFYWVRLIL